MYKFLKKPYIHPGGIRTLDLLFTIPRRQGSRTQLLSKFSARPFPKIWRLFHFQTTSQSKYIITQWAKIRPIWGRCYDHYFRRFLPIFCEKNWRSSQKLML
jgi:hypothetical protein